MLSSLIPLRCYIFYFSVHYQLFDSYNPSLVNITTLQSNNQLKNGSNMRIMITGSNGFIGSQVSAYLKEYGHRVFDCNRSILDLMDASAVHTFFNSNFFDVVIHCALIGREEIYTENESIVKDNTRIWDNLVNNRHRFRKLINFGSGHEFDINIDINFAEELDIFSVEPSLPYGKVKNMIARDLVQYEEFYNLRIFGIFHYSEGPKRFFKKIANSSKREFQIEQDKYVDYINLEDIFPMIDIIINGEAKHRDINLVYQDKLLLSEMAYMFNNITMSNATIIVNEPLGLSYTGDHRRFSSYGTMKMGLPLGFLRY